MSVLLIFNGPIDVDKVHALWYALQNGENYGAMASFAGTVRSEGGIGGLSFDIYEPILQSWFDAWQKQAEAKGAKLMMAHARGDVPVFASSYACAVFSPKRRVALEMLDAFVEDFKANAPIWKYDLVGGERRFASDRSTPMGGSGILADGEEA